MAVNVCSVSAACQAAGGAWRYSIERRKKKTPLGAPGKLPPIGQQINWPEKQRHFGPY